LCNVSIFKEECVTLLKLTHTYMRNCSVCGSQIPEGRLKAVPTAKTCVEHSTAVPFGLNIVQHGTLEADGYQEFEIVRDPRVLEELNHYKNQIGKYQ
jgi:hypothetical protein